jgi:predicted small secreted protein
MRVIAILLVLLASLSLAGCPVFTRGSGEGRPLEGPAGE